MESSTSAGREASAVLVLPDLFGMSYTDIPATVGRTAAAVRQLAARGRVHTEERTRRFPVDAAAGGDIQTPHRTRAPAKLATARDQGGPDHSRHRHEPSSVLQ